MGLEEGDCAGLIWVQDVPIVISDNQVQTQDPGQPQETKKIKKNIPECGSSKDQITA